MESFFTLEIILHFHGAHRADHTASWELLSLSMPLMHLPFGIILPREKNDIIFSIHPMLLENLNIHIFVLWCNVYVVLSRWTIESLESGVREDGI